jgi:hypothetical protein
MLSAILDTVLTIADTGSMILAPLRYGAVRGAATTGRGEHGSVRPGSDADHLGSWGLAVVVHDRERSEAL